MKIALCSVYPVFKGTGGTERVFWNMADAFIERGYTVIAIGFEKGGTSSFYPHSDKIHVYNAGSDYHRSFLINLWSGMHRGHESRRRCRDFYEGVRKGNRLKKILDVEEPDIIISYQLDMTYVLKDILKLTTPVITMFHNSMEQILQKKQHFFASLEKSECLQVLLPSYINDLKNYLIPSRVEAIPNLVPQYDECDVLNNRVILNVGRVDREAKRQHLLIEAFALVASNYPDWKVEIWGDKTDSKYAAMCQELILKHGLEDRVKLCGVTKNVEDVLRQGAIFVFPSRFEGFPLSLTEAMSSGIPAIGIITCSGTNELIVNESNGLLIDDGVDNLAKALARLMEDNELRVRLGHQAYLDMRRFAPDIIWDRWEKLCLELCSKHSESLSDTGI